MEGFVTDVHNSRRFANTVGLRIMAAAALLVVCLGIVFALFLSPAGPAAVEAQAAVYSAEQVADDDSSAAASPDGAAGAVSPDEASDSEGESPEEEVIEEDETPQSSGLGGGEPVSGGVGFGVVAIVGIAAVALFFLLLMRRLNGNINTMNRMFK